MEVSINNEKIETKYVSEYRDEEIRFAQKYEENIGKNNLCIIIAIFISDNDSSNRQN